VTDVSAGFPQVDLGPKATITVTLDDASAKITKLNVYGYTPDRSEDVTPEAFVPLFSYGSPPG